MSEARLDVLERMLDGFNDHDLDAIGALFADDCVLLTSRGPDACGRRFEGKAAVREGLRARFTGIPDVHDADGSDFVAGDRGVSQWTLTGTATDGTRVKVCGWNLWTFRGGEVLVKDSYWKIVEP